MSEYTVKPLTPFRHPDLSRFVVHFTSRPWGPPTPRVPDSIRQLSAKERLVEILLAKSMQAFPMFQTPDDVVCFTECTRPAIEDLIAQGRYDRWGIAFDKNTIFQRGGGPAFYVRGDAFHLVADLPPELRAFCTRYWPGVIRTGDDPFQFEDNLIDGRSEWIHEREWRIRGEGQPAAFQFRYGEVAFLVVPGPRQWRFLLRRLQLRSPRRARQVRKIPRVFLSEDGDVTDPDGAWLD